MPNDINTDFTDRSVKFFGSFSGQFQNSILKLLFFSVILCYVVLCRICYVVLCCVVLRNVMLLCYFMLCYVTVSQFHHNTA